MKITVDIDANVVGKLAAAVGHMGTTLWHAFVSMPIDLATSLSKTVSSGVAKLWSAVAITTGNLWKTLTFPFNSQIKPNQIWKNYDEILDIFFLFNI